jgi:hypothetical protein
MLPASSFLPAYMQHAVQLAEIVERKYNKIILFIEEKK